LIPVALRLGALIGDRFAAKTRQAELHRIVKTISFENEFQLDTKA
jgi:hypothetical protein